MGTEKSFDPLCRICLQEGADIPIIYQVHLNDYVHTKFEKCFKTKAESENGFPKNICELCNKTLDIVYDFITKFENSTLTLRNSTNQVIIDVKTENNNLDVDFQWPDEDTVVMIEIKKEIEVEVEPANVLEKLKPLPDLKVTKVNSENTEERTEPKTRKNKYNTNKQGSSVSENKKPRKRNKSVISTKKNEAKKDLPEQKLSKKLEIKEQPMNLCYICGNTYSQISTLKSHIASVHSKGPVTCPTCFKEYASQVRLTEHCRRFHQEKNLKCPKCPQAFATISVLNTHIKVVHNKHLLHKKYFSCKICNKTYKCRKSVVVHERAEHLGSRPATCNICLKSFYHKDNLKEHMRLHTGELPFKCPICDRGCTQLGNMKSHLRIHKISELTETIRSKLKPNYLKLLKNC